MSLLGRDAKLYFKVGGHVAGGGAWVEATNVRDLDSDYSKESADTTTRGSGGWKTERGTIRGSGIKFEMLFLPADELFIALKDVFLDTEEKIGIQCLSAAVADGGEGLQGDFMVKTFQPKQPIAGVQSVDVEIMLTDSEDPPVWLEP